MIIPLLKQHGACNALELHDLMRKEGTADGDILVADKLHHAHVELLLRNMQAECCDVDCEGGGALRMEAYCRHARALFPLAGMEPVGAVLGQGGNLEEAEGPPLRARLPGRDGGLALPLGAEEEEEEEEDDDGGGGGGRPLPVPPTKREWVIRVGGRSNALIGLGAAYAARARRSAALSNMGARPVTADMEDFGGGGGGSGGLVVKARKGASATAIAAAAAAALAATEAARARGTLRYDESAMEAEAEGGEDEDEEEEEEEEETGDFPRYRWVRKAGAAANFAHVPCGLCPVFEKCTPLGVISPATCVYLSAWMEAPLEDA